MYARTTTIHGDHQGIADGMTFIRDEAMPQLRTMDGFVGISMLAEGATGRCIVTSSWVDEAALHDHAERMGRMRERLVQSFHGDPDVDEWEIAVLHRVRPAGDGGYARVAWLEGDQADALVDGYRSTANAKLESLPGFCSVSLLVDRAGGRGVSTVTFESRESLERARDQVQQICDSLGGRVSDTAEMDLLMAHLHVPETA